MTLRCIGPLLFCASLALAACGSSPQSYPSSAPSLRSTAPRNSDLPLHQLELFDRERLGDPRSWAPTTSAQALGPGGASLAATGGSLTSRALHPEQPFRGVLPSWNAVVPEGAGMCVELQVAGEDWDWSPWLYFGDWGLAADPELRTTEFQQGRVQVDVLTLTRPANRLRWRVTGLGGPGTVRLERFALALEGLTDRSTHNPSDDEGRPLDLDLPARSQRVEQPRISSRICSPTAVAMAVDHFTDSAPTARVAELLFDPHNDIYGNWNRAVQGAFELGVRGHLKRFSNWQAVRASLASGHALVISIAAQPGQLYGAPYVSTEGHLIAISGLDGKGKVLCRDPAGDTAGEVPRTYRCKDLEQVWLRRGGVAYEFTEPRFAEPIAAGMPR